MVKYIAVVLLGVLIGYPIWSKQYHMVKFIEFIPLEIKKNVESAQL